MFKGNAAKAVQAEIQLRTTLEKELKGIQAEHGRFYLEGITPLFDVRKERRFNCDWNWGRQECFELYYDALHENPEKFGPNYCQRVISLINRSIPEVLEVCELFLYSHF